MSKFCSVGITKAQINLLIFLKDGNFYQFLFTVLFVLASFLSIAAALSGVGILLIPLFLLVALASRLAIYCLRR